MRAAPTFDPGLADASDSNTLEISLGRDRLDEGGASLPRRTVVEPRDIGEEDKRIGLDKVRD